MKKLQLLSTAVAFCMGLSLAGQSDLLLYNFNAIPQSLHTNPAYPQQTKVWVGLPALSGVHFSYHNSGFALIDLFEKGTDVNSNLDAVINNLDENSQLAIREEMELLGVGFRTKAGFWTIGARQIFDYKMDYPGDLMRLLRYGNAPQEFRNTSLSEFDYEVLGRTNYYIGWQHKFLNDKLSLGTRLKYVKGLQHSYAERTNVSIVTEDDSKLEIETDVLIKTAGIAQYLDDNPFELGSSIFPKNNGFAVDLGGVYDYNEKWQFSASVLDLGLINWNENTRDYVSTGTFEFDGIEADLSEDQPVEDFDNLVDSLEKAFEFDEVDGNTYSKALSSRVFLGANYRINDKHTFGALYHARIWQDQMFHDFSVNYQGRLARAFQYSVSYSIINGTYNNVGAGITAKLGPVQLYVLCDNALHATFPANLKTTNIRAGINLSFYGKKEPEEPKESPVVPATEDSQNQDNNENQQKQLQL